MSRRKERLEASLEGLFSKSKRRFPAQPATVLETDETLKAEKVQPAEVLPPPERQEKPVTIARERKVPSAKPKPREKETQPEVSPLATPATVAVERVESFPSPVEVTPTPIATVEEENVVLPEAEAMGTGLVLAVETSVEGRAEAERVESQIVTFVVMGNYYGVDVSSVQTIIKPQPVCPVPHTPDYLIGLTNLRGQVVPVIDLRMRLGYPPVENTKDTRVIIVEIDKEWAGILVEAVTGVMSLPKEAIEAASEILSKTDISLLSGVAKSDGKLILLLDVVKVFLLGLRESRGSALAFR